MTTVSQQGFFGYFGLRENPFHVSPNPRFYHSTPVNDSARQELLFGLQTRQGLLVLTGEAGTGKTTLLNSILDSLAHRGISTAYVFHPLLEPIELFECILRDFGVSYASNRKIDLLGALRDWLIARETVGDCPVVVIDEAQSLTLHMLDELRLLLNLETPRGKLLQIVLAGQPKLEEKLRRPELRQLRQRVVFHCKLTTLSEEQTAAYVQTRLSHAGMPDPDLFAPDALHSIFTHAKGIPRVINLLCEHALITAYGEQQHSIAADAIRRIAADFDLSAIPISVENDFSGSRLGRFQMFSVAEAKLDAVLPFDQPPSVAALQPNDGQRDLAEIAANPVTPAFVSPEVSHLEPESTVVAPFQSTEVDRQLAEIADAAVRPQFVSPEVSHPEPEPTVVAPFQSADVEGQLTEIAAAAVTPQFVSPKDSRPRSEASVVAPFQSADVDRQLAEIVAAAITPQFVSPKTSRPGSEASVVATTRPAIPPDLQPRREYRSYWRNSRSRVQLPVFLRRCVEAFTSYWREVGRSFIRDARYFFKPVTAPQPPGPPATRRQQAGQRRNPLHPVADWLRHPMVVGNSSGRNPRRTASQK